MELFIGNQCCKGANRIQRNEEEHQEKSGCGVCDLLMKDVEEDERYVKNYTGAYLP